MMTTPWRRGLRCTPAAFVLLALLLTLVGGCSSPPPFHATEVKGISYGTGLEIRDTRGQLRSLDEFAGKVSIVFFGFTSCPDVCPSTLMRLRQVRDSLGPQAAQLQVLLVSVDPERDSPERLEAYVRNFDPSFVGLRPEPDALDKVVKAFHAIAVKVPAAGGSDYTIDHSATLYVYDRKAKMRLIAQPDIPVDQLTSDLRRLLTE